MTVGYRIFRDSDEHYSLFRFPVQRSDFEYVWGPLPKAGAERRVREQFPKNCEMILQALRRVTIYDFWAEEDSRRDTVDPIRRRNRSPVSPAKR